MRHAACKIAASSSIPCSWNTHLDEHRAVARGQKRRLNCACALRASLRRHLRTVRGIGHHPYRHSCEVCRHVLRPPLPRGTKAVPVDVAHVWGDDDVVERSEGVIRGERLTVEDVETGTGEVTRTESLDKGRLLDDRTAGDVHQDGASLHLGEVVGTQRVARAL